MYKYCKICNTPLEAEMGLCPNCDRLKLRALREIRRDHKKSRIIVPAQKPTETPVVKKSCTHVASQGKKQPHRGRILIILSVVALMLMALVFLPKVFTKQALCGPWYSGSDDSPQFTLYQDGTADIAHVYGMGTWSLTNGDQLVLRDFYGSTERFTLKQVTATKMVLGAPDGMPSNGETITFWRNVKLAQKEDAL